MIEIRKRESSDGEREYDLFIDDTMLENAIASRDTVLIRDRKVFNELGRNSFLDLNGINYIHLEFPFDGMEKLLETVSIVAPVDTPGLPFMTRSYFELAYNFDSNSLHHWNKPFSYSDFINEFLFTCEEISLGESGEFQKYGENEVSAVIRFWILDPNLTMGSEFERTLPIVQSVCDETIRRLRARADSTDSITTAFDFPAEVKVPCEQYLVYFVQFLRDIGVEATSDLQHQAGRVLFTVTPTDKSEGLAKIKAALDIYIKLPSSPLDDSSLETDFAIQRLVGNIHHLKGQLALTHAIMQAQQITIGHLQVDVMRKSLIEANPPAADQIDLLGGLAAITPYEGKGFKINLPKLFRFLKDTFDRKD